MNSIPFIVQDVDDGLRAQQAARITTPKSEPRSADAAIQSDAEMSDADLLRAYDEVDRATALTGSQLTDSQLVNAAGDAERTEPGANAIRMVERVERAAGESAALNPTGTNGGMRAPVEPNANVRASSSNSNSSGNEAHRSTTLKAYTFIPPTQTLAADSSFANASRPMYCRQEGINETSAAAQGVDVLASQTIQAGGGVKRVHAKLILSNNKPGQLLIQSTDASGSSSNANASGSSSSSNANAGIVFRPLAAKRGRPSKRDALDQPH